MNQVVRALHEGARRGSLAFEDADRKINQYLVVAAVLELDPTFLRPEWLVLPLEDAPQAGRCADLGPVLRSVFSRRRPGSSLQRWVEQAIPCFRKGGRTLHGAADNDPPCCRALVNLLMTFALGTYHGLTHRPPFRVRMVVYAWLHRALTGTDHELAQFVQANRNAIYLAVAEYLARLLPEVFPVEHELVQEGPWNLDRVPSVADDARARLTASVLACSDPLRDPASAERVWASLEEFCSSFFDKWSRVRKRRVTPLLRRRGSSPAGGRQPEGATTLVAHETWDVPMVSHFFV